MLDQNFFWESIENPARFKWHEVKKVDHYYLSVDAVTRPMLIREELGDFRNPKE